VVDVVVRDGSGRPVPDLGADDFEVYEDGARQRITSFEFVDLTLGSTPLQSPSAEAHTVAAAPRYVSDHAVIAMAFEELSAQGRQLAEKAAGAFVSGHLGAGDAVGVFAVDRALHMLMAYTTDRAALRRAIDVAAQRAGYPLERAGQVPGAEFGSAQGGQPSQATKDESPYFRASATFRALDRLIESMRPLPGRKAVVLFSEGLALGPSKDSAIMPGRHWHDDDNWLSDNRYERFVHLIERANSAQVAFYTFDAAGLRIDSPLVDACFGCAPYVGLQFLADETGGAFVENTNDLAAGIRRVAADLHQYYLLGYTPTNSKVDGTFRKISVKVRRRNVTVLARKGYRARGKAER
jgi:VWFA-related protein